MPPVVRLLSSSRKLSSVGDLNRRLGQQLRTIEGLEQLAVEFRAVGDDDESRVLQLGLQGDQVGVEFHLHGLARALGVPDDAGLAVALDGGDSRSDGFGDGEVLVRLGDPLRVPLGTGIEGDEVPLQLQEPLRIADSVDQVLEFDTETVISRDRYRP